MLAELSYQAFLEYQRAINVAHFAEIICSEYVYYAQIEPYKFFPLTNDTQKEMVKCRKKEWAVVPDAYVSVPIQYDPAVFEKIEIAAQDVFLYTQSVPDVSSTYISFPSMTRKLLS